MSLEPPSKKLRGQEYGTVGGSLRHNMPLVHCIKGPNWGTQIGNLKNIEGIQKEHKDPGRYVPLRSHHIPSILLLRFLV